MAKSILAITILALSTSGALAAHRTHHYHHGQAMNAYGTVAAPPFVGMGGVSSSDHATYMKNLHDSGYNPKNNFNTNGTVATQ
jgi:hypothetical protein